ncbi:MAG: hypothetical protein QNJ72_23875 [Pleurocapsa sp. MO_226.B13]|nr:hypothetical protein [Pleurocapsa sp. MO_226.B13]
MSFNQFQLLILFSLTHQLWAKFWLVIHSHEGTLHENEGTKTIANPEF